MRILLHPTNSQTNPMIKRQKNGLQSKKDSQYLQIRLLESIFVDVIVNIVVILYLNWGIR